jgi:hypothetical protein
MYTFLVNAPPKVSEQAQRDWDAFAARQRRKLHPPIVTLAYVRTKTTATSYTTRRTVRGEIPNNPGNQI